MKPANRSLLQYSKGLSRTLPILAGLTAACFFSCSEHNASTGPILAVGDAADQAAPIEDPIVFGDVTIQPDPNPGKDRDPDALPPVIEHLPDELSADPVSTVPAIPDGPTYIPDLVDGAIQQPGMTRVTVNGNLGGTVERGIFRLDVPRNAVDGDVDFEISIPDDGAIRVELSPHGLAFDKPVLLTIDLNYAAGLGDKVKLFSWNEKEEHWVVVGGKFNPKTRLLTCNLDHFSTYAPGRAGWIGGSGKPEESTDTKTNQDKK